MNEAPNGKAQREEVPSFLRQFTRRGSSSAGPEERCELCSAPLATAHQHLLDPKKRQIVCACDGCVILFCGQTGAHYLRVPRRIQRLSGFRMTDLQWESLMIPINLAFFYRDSAANRVLAMYPSPAGATESLLSLESWEEIAAQNKALQRMEPDVEALLVNRIDHVRNNGQGGGAAAEYFIVPIDECYRLVGIIRMHWHGLSGGTEVWREIHQFFGDLKSRSVSVEEPANA
jgi:hypothetical protein